MNQSRQFNAFPSNRSDSSFSEGQIDEFQALEDRSPRIQAGFISQPSLSLTSDGTSSRNFGKTLPLEFKDHCEVCYSKVSQDFLQEDSKQLFEIIYCKGCQVSAHRICYGLVTPVEDDVYQGHRVKYFQCDQCREVTSNRVSPCYVCESKEGCLRFTKDKKWIHAVCGIGNQPIRFTDVQKMTLDGKDFSKSKVKKRSCTICKSKVGTQNFEGRGFMKNCHMLCALKQIFNEQDKAQWRVHFSMAVQEGFTGHQVIDKEKILKNLEGSVVCLKEAIDETGLAKKNYESILNKWGLKTPRGKKKAENESLQRALLEEYLTQAKNQLQGEGAMEIQQVGNEENAQNMGGKMSLEFKSKTQQKQEKNMEIEEEEMQFPNQKEVIRELYNEIFVGRAALIDTNNEDKTNRLRSDFIDLPCINKLSFPELLFFVTVFQKRAEIASEVVCSSEDLGRLINSARLLPFSLDTFLTALNNKYYTGVATDILMNSAVQSCVPKSAFEWPKKAFNKTFVSENKTAFSFAKQIQAIYKKDSCGVLTALCEEGAKYYQQLSFLDSFAGQLEKFYTGFKIQSPQNSILESLFAGAMRVGLPKEFGEMKLLEENKMRSSTTKGLRRPGEMEEEVVHSARSSKAKIGSSEAEIASSEDLLIKKPQPKSGRPEENQGKNSRSRGLTDMTNKESASAKGSKSSSDVLKPFSIPKSSPLLSVGSDSSGRNQRSVQGGSSKSKESSTKMVIEEEQKGSMNKSPEIGKSPSSTNSKDLQALKRSRTQILEKKEKEIEDEYQLKIKALNQKITMEEAQKFMGSFRTLTIGGKAKDPNWVQEQMRKVNSWRERYDDCVGKNRGGLNELVGQIEEIGIRIPEMNRALDLNRGTKIWKNRATEIQRRLKSKVEDIFDENEDLVEIEELEKIIKDAESLKFIENDEGMLQEFKTRKASVKKLQERCQNPGQTTTFNQLKDIEKMLKPLNVKIPEFVAIKAKLEVNYELQKTLEETVSLEELEKLYTSFGKKDFIVDRELCLHLSSKISEGKRIQGEARKLSKFSSDYKRKTLSQMIALVKDAEMNKILSPDITQIKAFVDSLNVFSSVYGILFNTQPLDFEEPETRGPEKSLSDLISTCKNKLGRLDLYSDENITRLKTLTEQFEVLSKNCFESNLRENLFCSFFRNLSQSLQNIPVRRVSQSPSLNQPKRSVAPQIVNPNRMEEEKVDLRETEKRNQKITEWKDRVHEFLYQGPEEALFEKLENATGNEVDYERLLEELRNLKGKIQNLMKTYTEELGKCEEGANEFGTLGKIFKFTEWTVKAISSTRQISEDRRPLDCGVLRTLWQQMEELKISQDSGVCRMIGQAYGLLESVSKEFGVMYPQARFLGQQSRQTVNKGQKQKLSEAEIRRLKVKEILEKTKEEKIFIESLENVHNTLKEIEQFVKVTNELNQVQKDIEAFEPWAMIVEDLAHKYMNCRDDDLSNKEKLMQLKADLDIIKKMLVGQRVVRMEEGTLRLLDWVISGGMLFFNQGNGQDFDEWRMLLEDAEEFGEVEGDNGRFMNLKQKIKQEVERAYQVRKTVKKMRDGEKVELNSVIFALQNVKVCQIRLEEEMRILEKEHGECLEVIAKIGKFYGRVVGERKGSLQEFQKCLQQIEGLKINLSEESEKLKKAVKIGEGIREESIRREKEYNEGKQVIETMKTLVEKYKGCFTFIEEAERVQEILERLLVAQNFIKGKLKELASVECKIKTFSELQQVEKKLEEAERMAGIHEKKGGSEVRGDGRLLRKEIFLKKCEVIKKRVDFIQREKDMGIFKPFLKYDMMKELMVTCDKMSHEYKDAKMTKAVEGLKRLGKETEEILSRIVKAKKAEDIAGIQKIVNGVVDISEQLEKKKEELKLKRSAEKPKEKANRDGISMFDRFLKERGYGNANERVSNKDFEERDGSKEVNYFESYLPKELSRDPSRQSSNSLRAFLKKDHSKPAKFSPINTMEIEESEKRFSVSLKEKKNSGGKNALEQKQFQEASSQLMQFLSSNKIQSPAQRKQEPEDQSVTKTPKDRHSVLSDLNKLLESSEHFEMSLLECFEGSRAILASFPEMLEKADVCTRFFEKLEYLWKQKYVSQAIKEKKYEKEYLKGLLELGKSGVDAAEKKLREAAERKGGKIEGDQKGKLGVPSDANLFTPSRNSKNQMVGSGANDKISTASTNNPGTNTAQLTSISKRLAFDRYDSGTMADTKDKPNLFQSNMMQKNPVANSLISQLPVAANLIQFDPFNVQKGNQEAQVSPRESEGQVLKIFEGTLNYEKTNKEYQMLGFYSCDPMTTITSIPQIAEKGKAIIRIEGQLAQTRFETFLNNAFNQWDKKLEKIISGWIESSISIYRSRCDQMAKELLESGKVSMSTYHESTKIFFLHQNQLPDIWRVKLNFQIKKIRKNSDPSLCFIIIHKPYKLTSLVKTIEPEVIQIAEAEPVAEKNSGEKISVASSVEKEAEMDFGAEVYHDQQGGVLLHEEENENTMLTIEASVTRGNSVMFGNQHSNQFSRGFSYSELSNNQGSKKVENGKRSFEKMYGNSGYEEKSIQKKLKDGQGTGVVTQNKENEFVSAKKESKRSQEKKSLMNSAESIKKSVSFARADSERKSIDDKTYEDSRSINKSASFWKVDRERKPTDDKTYEKKRLDSRSLKKSVSIVRELIHGYKTQTDSGRKILEVDTEVDELQEEVDQIEEEREVEEQLLEKLRKMDQFEIISYAKGLNQAERDSIIQILKDAGHHSESSGSSKPKAESIVIKQESQDYDASAEKERTDADEQEEFGYFVPEAYVPPDYIQQIYDLFTTEELERAAQKASPKASNTNAIEVEEEEEAYRTGSEFLEVPSIMPYSGSARKSEEKPRGGSRVNVLVEQEMRAIQAENQAKFLTLMASRASVQKTVSKISPLENVEMEVVPHNPIIRQRIKEQLQREQSMKEESTDTTSVPKTQNQQKIQEEEENVSKGITLAGVTINEKSITFSKELYDKIMATPQLPQGFTWELPKKASNNANQAQTQNNNPPDFGNYQKILENLTKFNLNAFSQKMGGQASNEENYQEEGEEGRDEIEEEEVDGDREGDYEEGEENGQEENQEENDNENQIEIENDNENYENQGEGYDDEEGYFENQDGGYDEEEGYNEDGNEYDDQQEGGDGNEEGYEEYDNEDNNDQQNEGYKTNYPRQEKSFPMNQRFDNPFGRHENSYSHHNSRFTQQWNQEIPRPPPMHYDNNSNFSMKMNHSHMMTQPNFMNPVSQIHPPMQQFSQMPMNLSLENLKDTLNRFSNQAFVFANQGKSKLGQ